MKKLTQEEIIEGIETLSNDWKISNQFIFREFVFENFINAFSFMTSIALEAEKINHHPNWENVYNKVKISLSTHDVNGLTEKDFNLAAKIDAIYMKNWYNMQETS